MSDRAWRPLVPGLIGLGLVVLLATGAIWARCWRLAARPGELPNVPLATDKVLGINADLSDLDSPGRQEALGAMEAAGFRWLRHRFPWDAIEPARGRYDWAVWDEIVEEAKRHRLRLIAILDGSPAWARAAEDFDNSLAPPVETRDFGDFAESFAARYADQIDYYQVWEEPNIAPHWGAREIDPAAYFRLLREGAIRIRGADPQATILTAALAPNVEPGGANMSDALFLDALYQQGAAEWFDVVSAQTYVFEEPADAPPDPDSLNWRRIELLRKVMETHGDVGKAMWAVSFGLMNVPPEAVRAIVEQAREDWPWLGPMLWAAWSPEDAHGQYAVAGSDREPGAIYETLQGLARSAELAWPGVYMADDRSGRYEGDWRVTSSGADIGGSGDRLIVPFRGTRLDLTVRRGDYRAFLFVAVDGQPANALPRDPEGRAYVVLYDPLGRVATVTITRGLPAGDHVVEIVADRGWGQWAIVGWAVSREMTGHWPWLPIGLGLAAIVTLGVTSYTIWPHRNLLLGSVSTLMIRCRAFDDRVVLALTAGAATLLYVVDGTIPILGTVALLALLLFLRPEMGLPLIAFALPFHQPGRPVLGKVFSIVEILTLLAAVGWLINRVLGIDGPSHQTHTTGNLQGKTRGAQRESRLVSWVSRFTPLDWGVLALVVVGALSLSWAEHTRVAAREFRTVVLEAGIFYALLRVLVPPWLGADQQRRSAWRLADAWVLGGFVIALVGLYQWVFGQDLITAEGVWRVRGFYGSPNNLALYLGKMFPLGVAIALWGQKGWRQWAYGLAALVMAAVIFLTYSRGAWVVGVPVSLLFLAAMRGRRALAIVVGLMTLVAIVLFLVVGIGRLTSLLDTTQGTTFFRLQLWQSSWVMLRDHLVLGVGLDYFLYHYRTYYVLPTAWEEFNLSHPHNLVLDFWLRLGLPGLVVFCGLLVAFFRRGARAYRQLAEGSERLLVLGLMAGMVNLIAHGLLDHAFFLVDLAFTFMLMLALVQVTYHERRVSAPDIPHLEEN